MENGKRGREDREEKGRKRKGRKKEGEGRYDHGLQPHQSKFSGYVGDSACVSEFLTNRMNPRLKMSHEGEARVRHFNLGSSYLNVARSTEAKLQCIGAWSCQFNIQKC